MPIMHTWLTCRPDEDNLLKAPDIMASCCACINFRQNRVHWRYADATSHKDDVPVSGEQGVLDCDFDV